MMKMMKKNASLICFIFSIILIPFNFSKASESYIPLEKGIRPASDDLVYEGRVLSLRDADDLRVKQNLDLSLLNPFPNEIWQGGKTVLDDQSALALKEGESLSFEGALRSNSGLYRFNARALNRSSIYTVHLDKTLHSLLLRKNILRLLGYKIPAVKYLKRLTIIFSNETDLGQFLKKEIPENTLGAKERWVTKIDGNRVELQDVAVTEPSENDYYNVALGIPTVAQNSRSIRSLVLPYSWLDLYESVNQFSWIDGKIDNKAIVLPHFTGNSFSTSLDDGKWMLRKINLLNREDIQTAVNGAFFPPAVASVLIEKLVSRKNSLNKIFNEKNLEMSFNQKISSGADLLEGKVLKENFDGFASRFSHGDADSPIGQMQYYLLAKLQANVLDNLINKANSYIEAFDIEKVRSKYFSKQFEDGLSHFLQTGELRPIGIGAWTSPLLNGQLIFSRDIIVGNYLGTDNLVQLADTIGASVNAGVHIGVEGIGSNLFGNAKAEVSFVRTYTHVKPVKNLKESLKEPYKNMFVPLLKNSLKESFFTLSELKKLSLKNDEQSKKIQDVLKEINTHLDTGESLIITDRFMPSADVNLNYSNGIVGGGIGIGGSSLIVKRIQIYKRSPKILQIYDDYGLVGSFHLSFQVNAYIPILKIKAKMDKGHYKIKSYLVDLSSDLEENPDFYANALGLYNVLKNRNFELLETTTKAVNTDVLFTDKSLGFSLLAWKMRLVKGKTYYKIDTKDGLNGQYFSLNKDFSNGFNIESFVKQIANYYLGKLLNGDVGLTVESDNQNPGNSFFGRSKTQSIRFEASVDISNSLAHKFDHKFISLSDVREGWSVSRNKLKSMMIQVNEKLGTNLFDVNQIDFKKLKLFKVGYHINIYERGIEKLNLINEKELTIIENRYKKIKDCKPDDPFINTATCGVLNTVFDDLRRSKKSKNEEDRAVSNVDLFDHMVSDMKFSDVLELIGINNIYVYATVDGLRKDSEILNDTVYSNSMGSIGSKEWEGPLEVVRNLLGLSNGELSGTWLREFIAH